MLVLCLVPSSALEAGRALLTRARSMASPVYVTSDEDRTALYSLAEVAEAEARATGAAPQWPRDAELLCQRWRLVATTKLAGSELLQQMGGQPALGTFAIGQNWRQRDGALRCDNIISIGRPNGGLLSAWTLLPAGGQSSLRLQHSARLLDDGTSTAGTPLRFCMTLDAFILDGNRRAGEPVQTIVSVPLPPRFPGLPSPPALPIPRLAAAIAEAGTFDITYLDENVRVARGVENGGRVLRIFAREGGDGMLPTW